MLSVGAAPMLTKVASSCTPYAVFRRFALTARGVNRHTKNIRAVASDTSFAASGFLRSPVVIETPVEEDVGTNAIDAPVEVAGDVERAMPESVDDVAPVVDPGVEEEASAVGECCGWSTVAIKTVRQPQ